MATNKHIIANAFTCDAGYIYKVPVSELRMDYSYQRVSGAKVKDIMNEYDPKKAGLLLVNYRPEEDLFYIIDGGHRFEAAKRLGKEFMDCQIEVGMTVEEEAKRFAEQEKNKTKLKPFHRFHAAKRSGDAIANDLQRLCDAYSIKIVASPKDGDGSLKGLAYAWSVAQAGKLERLDWIFKVIKMAAWHYAAGAYNTATLEGLDAMYDKLRNVDNGEIVLMNVLRMDTPTTLKQKALGHHHGRVTRGAIAQYLNEEVEHALKTRMVIPMETMKLMEAR